MNRDILDQEPCNTCGYEEGSVYCKEHCPHEAKIGQEPKTDSWSINDVVDTFKKHGLIKEQEPCEMTAEEYRQRMIQAFHNADTDELISICVLPTEKEFEHLEWLLKNHYKKEPCGNAIDRAEAIKIASGYCHPANVAKELAKLPSVNPQPCEDAISRQAVQDYVAKYLSQYLYNDVREAVEVIDDYIGELPSVTPQPKTGEWNTFELFQSGIKETWYECPKCKWSNALLIPRNYCPNCGCRMVEPQERNGEE